MKAPRYILVISLCIVSAISLAQTIDTEIKYSTVPSGSNIICYIPPGNKLVINDFRGVPAEGNAAVAITSSGFSFKAGFKNSASKTSLIITVFCNFDKSLSWMKENGKNDYILTHEQHHFDIAYLSTLAFMQKLKHTDFTVANYQEKLQAIYTTAMEDMEQLQHQYDSETQNGQLKEIQLAWNKKIEDRLVEIAAK